VIGTQHQAAILEDLLAHEPDLINSIGWRHFKLELVSNGEPVFGDGAEPSIPGLRVTNVSSNIALVGTHPLHPGKTEEIINGDTLGFAAPASQVKSERDPESEDDVVPFLTWRVVAPLPPPPQPPCVLQPAMTEGNPFSTTVGAAITAEDSGLLMERSAVSAATFVGERDPSRRSVQNQTTGAAPAPSRPSALGSLADVKQCNMM